MFVLEKLLRGLSEETTEKSALIPKIISVYDELIGKLEELRRSQWSKIDSEYYQRLRMLIDPYLKTAVEGINNSVNDNIFVDYLKIVMFAHDNKLSVPFRDEIDWIGVVKRLMDELEGNEGLMIRVLRYLKTREAEYSSETIETIPLLLMNTLNKMLTTNKSNDIFFVVQTLNLLDFPTEGSGIEKNLLLLLRSSGINDRIKAMIVRILLNKMAVDVGEVKRMLGEDKVISAVISAELGSKDLKRNTPLSSSKVVNYLNDHFEVFTEAEQVVLGVRNNENVTCSNGYERFLLALKADFCDCNDPNVLREFYRQKNKNLPTGMFIERLGDGLEIEDYELIVCRCHEEVEVNLFWECLNRIPWLTEKVKSLEAKRELFSPIDFESSSIAVQYYFFKVLEKFRDLDTTDNYKEIAVNLYEKYKEDLNVSGIFKEYIK